MTAPACHTCFFPMGELFGTDGIRAPSGEVAALAADVGAALAVACRQGALGSAAERPRVVVGRDTRPSGPAIEEAVSRGLTSAGADVLRADVIPTAGVVYLTA